MYGLHNCLRSYTVFGVILHLLFASAVCFSQSRFHGRKSECVAEQLIRPTGLLDPEIEVRPVDGQIDDIISEINIRKERGERVLITTLTKKMAESLTDYLDSFGIKVRYMHYDIDTIDIHSCFVRILRASR